MHIDTVKSDHAGFHYPLPDESRARQFLTTISRDLGLPSGALADGHFTGSGEKSSASAVSDLATAAVAAAGSTIAELDGSPTPSRRKSHGEGATDEPSFRIPGER